MCCDESFGSRQMCRSVPVNCCPQKCRCKGREFHYWVLEAKLRCTPQPDIALTTSCSESLYFSRSLLVISSTSWTSSHPPITCPRTATSSTATSPPSVSSSATYTTTTSPSGTKPHSGSRSVGLIFDADFEVRWKADFFSPKKLSQIVQR